MNILILGGAGYIGSMLADSLLKRDLKVTVVDNLLYNQWPLVHHILRHPNCNFYKLDVMDTPQEVIAHSDIIYHMAAWVGAPKCDSNKEEADRVNAYSVKHLVKRLSKNQRLIFPCTNSGYGSQYQICTEDTPMKSLSIYGSTKEEGEKYAMEHPNTTSFRLATVWGISYRPRIDLMVNYFTYLATIKKEIEVFQGNYKRNFVHINDVVKIFDLSKNNDKLVNQIFNLGCDEDNTTKMELVDKIKNYLPDTIIKTSNEQDPDKRNYNVSSEKLKQAGYEATLTINKNLKPLIDFYKNMFAQETWTMIQMMKNI